MEPPTDRQSDKRDEFMAEKQCRFLLEEYKYIHESIFRSNDKIVTGIRFFITLLAATAGGIFYGATTAKMAPDGVASCVVGASAFFFLLGILGSFMLLASRRNEVHRLRALNAVRRAFLDIDITKRRYFLMPVSDCEPRVPAVGGWPAVYFCIFFSAVFSFSGSLGLAQLLKWSSPIAGCIGIALGCAASHTLAIVIVVSHIKDRVRETVRLHPLDQEG